MKKLRVVSLQIRDVLGCREMAVEPGNITVFSGKNGSGKTSAIESLKTVLGGGKLANIKYVPAEGEKPSEPEVVIVLEGGGEKYIVKKTEDKIGVKKQSGDSAGYIDVPSPQRWLAGLLDSKMSNPLDFMRASDKDRVMILLGTIPLTLDSEQLWLDMGIKKSDISPVPTGLHPLQELELIREAVFRERTGVNRDAGAKTKSAEQTRLSAPAVVPDDFKAEIADLDADINRRDNDIAKKMGELKSLKIIDDNAANTQYSESTENIEKIILETERAEKEKITERIAIEKKITLEIESAANAAIAVCRERMSERLLSATNERDAALSDAKDSLTEKMKTEFDEQRNNEQRRGDLSLMRERAEMSIKAQTLHNQAKVFDSDADQLIQHSILLSSAIAVIDQYHLDLANNLPIKGLRLDDKKILVNDVPYSQLNTAQQIDIAVRISCFRAKGQNLPLVYVDGAESLDAANFEVLCDVLSEQNVQAVIGQVKDYDLKISTK